MSPPPPRDTPGATFTVDTRRSLGYRGARTLGKTILRVWFRPRVHGAISVPAHGPVVLTPVHRSNLDFAFPVLVTERKLFFMTKDSVWRSRALGWLVGHLGGFPVHRESADRGALRIAEEVLRQEQVLVLFPEGRRQDGPVVQELLEGAAFLAGRTGATIVPIGIGGSDAAMPKGGWFPKPVPVTLVVGEPVAPPEPGPSGRVPRARVHACTQELRQRIQAAYDEART